jgi:serine/threonine protein kinase
VNNLREIQALRRLSPHEHIITLEEVLYDQPTGRLALVFELMDANLYELIRGESFVHYCFCCFLYFELFYQVGGII